MAIHEGKPYPMFLNDYQAKAAGTAIYPGAGSGSPMSISYVLLGLAGEVGEITNKYKKVLRGDAPGEELRRVLNEIALEAGDALWYLSMLATELGWSLDDIADHNVTKLDLRQQRGTLRGHGDNR